ncbi:MAG: hypothetical protein JWM80_11 [Cyanobacteria bacterium RYN_339]|nr:hypothetical protein [Cyanobacteria bacterium RYN_339]
MRTRLLALVLLLGGCRLPAPAPAATFVLVPFGSYEVGTAIDVVGGYVSLEEASRAEAQPDLEAGGLVADEQGRPLADVLVSTSDGRSARTNARGLYTLEGVAPVDGGFVAYRAGYVAEGVVGAPEGAPNFVLREMPAAAATPRPDLAEAVVDEAAGTRRERLGAADLPLLAVPDLARPAGIGQNGPLQWGAVPGATSYQVALAGPGGLIWEAVTPAETLALSFQGEMPEATYSLAVTARDANRASTRSVSLRLVP